MKFSKQTVLYVENEEHVYGTFISTLESFNLNVVHYVDPLAAIDKHDLVSASAFIIDLATPNMSGTVFADILITKHSVAEEEIIFHTAYHHDFEAELLKFQKTGLLLKEGSPIRSATQILYNLLDKAIHHQR